jgi:hypothetical protein
MRSMASGGNLWDALQGAGYSGNLKSQTMRALRGIVVVILILFGCASAVMGQTGTATLSGIVTDESGGLIVKAELELKSADRGFVTTTKSNNDGIYVFTGIFPGAYQITIRKAGFKQVDFVDLVLNTQDHVQQNFRLQVGSMSESVTINAWPDAMPTDNAAIGLLVGRDFIDNMPLNGRSLWDLIGLTPGTVGLSVNGQYSDANYFTVDGVSANTQPSYNPQGFAGVASPVSVIGTTQPLVPLDALQEFKVQTAGYSAEYGRQPGGQFALTTRSGGNVYHGSLYDYLRNTVFDANNWFLNASGSPRPPEHQNDFGGTFSGPIRIPRVYNGHDKTFFFFTYEGLRLEQPAYSGLMNVPTVAFRQFAAPAFQPFMNSFPLPNGPNNNDQCAAPETFSCTAVWSASFPQLTTLDSYSARVDQAITDRVQIFGRYTRTPSQGSSLYAPGGVEYNSGTTQTVTLGAVFNAKANLTDEFRFNYTEGDSAQSAKLVAMDGSVPFSLSDIIPKQYSGLSGGANFYIFEVGSLGYAYGSSIKQHQINLIDSILFTHGTHSMKVGGDYRRLSPVLNQGTYAATVEVLSPETLSQSIADYVVVDAAEMAQPVFYNLSLYAQDHWRIFPNLTLDYGLRWEFNPPPGSLNGIYAATITTTNLADAQIAPNGTPLYRTRYDNFAPRIGFAYQVGNVFHRPTVIRGGFGIFYDTGQALGSGGYTTGYPFTNYNLLQNVAWPTSAQTLAPPPASVPLVPPYNGLFFQDPHLTLPYTEQWNLTASQGISARNTLTASYVGNRGNKLLFTGFYPDVAAINQNFTQLTIASNAGASSYNALQVLDQGEIVPGMQLIASFTWAHAIDNVSNDFSQTAPVWGNSDSDVREIFNLGLNYKVPFSSSNRFVRALASGWSVDERFGAQSGGPVNIIQNNYVLPNGQEAFFLPNLVRGIPLYLHNVPGVLGGWELNKAAFSLVPTDPQTGAPLAIGTLSRNYVHGPAFWNLNSAMQRSFHLGERLNLLFRVEAFNLFNHANPGQIVSNLTSSAFGTAGGYSTTGAPNILYASGGPRSLQFVLKLQF